MWKDKTATEHSKLICNSDKEGLTYSQFHSEVRFYTIKRRGKITIRKIVNKIFC